MWQFNASNVNVDAKSVLLRANANVLIPDVCLDTR